jgi:hypothetical protein
LLVDATWLLFVYPNLVRMRERNLAGVLSDVNGFHQIGTKTTMPLDVVTRARR